MPDPALVTPCDTSERDPVTNGDLAGELSHTRKQRDDCAAKVDGMRQWRGDAIRRAQAAGGSTPKKGISPAEKPDGRSDP